jgi:hypothetical protein
MDLINKNIMNSRKHSFFTKLSNLLADHNVTISPEINGNISGISFNFSGISFNFSPNDWDGKTYKTYGEIGENSDRVNFERVGVLGGCDYNFKYILENIERDM